MVEFWLTVGRAWLQGPRGFLRLVLLGPCRNSTLDEVVAHGIRPCPLP